MIKYSFIIPIIKINDYIRESIPKILEIPRDDFEIIVYPDKGHKTDEIWPKTRQIESDRRPSVKRSQAMRDAKGEFLVFIDDDAYPKSDILDILDKDFENENIAAVGGPAITPENDTFLQKVSGAVYLSYFSGGFPERYVSLGKKKFITDWPSVNLAVRKNIFLEVGGFNCDYWPGEDTKFCLDIIKKVKAKNKIIYDPNAVVWHHRREGLFRHLKQISGYGIHRGFFAKRYPETSFKLRYFIPSAFFVFIFIGAFLASFYPFFMKFYLIGWIAYGLAMIKVLWDISTRQKNIPVALYSLIYVFLTHIVYGFKFIQGLIFTQELKSKLK